MIALFHGFSIFSTGSSDGQTLVVREGDNGMAYSWNSREQKWDKVLLLRNSFFDHVVALV